MSTNQIKNIIENAQEIMAEQDQPQPLRKPKAEAQQFPVKVLPTILQNAVLRLHKKIQAPLAICAQSILAVSNLAVQGHANIMLPTIGQHRPISCFFLTIAESGERKSSCDNEALAAIKTHEAKLKADYDASMESWQNASDAFETQRQMILKDRKHYQDINSKKKALDNLGRRPSHPLTPLLICPEPTFEGLCKLMQNGHPSLGIFSAEGGQFISGHGMKEENKIRTATALSSAWDGEAIKRIRAGDGATILVGRRLSMHLMAQPTIAASFLSDLDLKSQGLLSRVLVTSPRTAIGTRFQRKNNDSEAELLLDPFEEQITIILSLQPKTKLDCLNELEPRIIRLTKEAKKIYQEYADRTEEKMIDGGIYESIRGFASKLPEHALRLAATMALVEDIGIELLNPKYLEIGIEVANFYASESLRLFDEGVTDPKIILAEKLLNWLHNNWHEAHISLPDIYQSSINAISTKAKATEIVKILEEHGWLIKNKGTMEVKGKVRRESWRVANHRNKPNQSTKL